MKKLFLALCAVLVTISGFAKEIDVVQGKANMKKREGLAYITFNWGDALWDNKRPIKEQWGDEYDTYVAEGEKAFIAMFNEKSKKLFTTENAEGANYIIHINFTNFDYYFSAMSFIPGHKHKVWANVTIKDVAAGEIVCKILVTELTGDRDSAKFDSFLKMMQSFAEELAQLK